MNRAVSALVIATVAVLGLTACAGGSAAETAPTPASTSATDATTKADGDSATPADDAAEDAAAATERTPVEQCDTMRSAFAQLAGAAVDSIDNPEAAGAAMTETIATARTQAATALTDPTVRDTFATMLAGYEKLAAAYSADDLEATKAAVDALPEASMPFITACGG